MRDYKNYEAEEAQGQISFIRTLWAMIASACLMGIIMHSCVGGIVKQAEIDEAETRGRMLLMQQVMDEMERTGEDYRYFFTYASKPQSTGLYHAVLMRGAECRQ